MNTNGKTVRVSDKRFKLLYDALQINEQVARIAKEIRTDLAGRKPLFVCVLNGAFVLAADLLREVAMPCEVRFVRLASYNGTKSTGTVNNLLDIDTDISGRDVVVVEDIVETGRTMHYFTDDLKTHGPASVKIASLVTKPERLIEDVKIDYIGFKMKANDFIVGYGMDYNQEGRNLPDIYIVEE